jgi:2-succinyl-6-hydroxy-2,4-cyclohexadiene-1-carboxylate synthase
MIAPSHPPDDVRRTMAFTPSPPRLLALHGFTEDDTVWNGLLPDGLPSTTPLLPGHGWSPCPPGLDADAVADAAAARLTQPALVVGYSMGGRVALALACRAPERVAGLVLISCHAGLRDSGHAAARRAADGRLADSLEEAGIGPFVAAWQAHPALVPAQPFSRTQLARLRALRLGQSAHGLAACLRILGQGSMAARWSALSGLGMPCLLIAGSRDGTYRQAMAEMADQLPRGRLVVVEECGHAVHREHPQVLRQLLAEAARGL